MPPLTPMPQAPAPQHNGAFVFRSELRQADVRLSQLIAPYTSRHVPAPNLTNSAMTDKLFRDGNIYLSINDAVAMAIENNLDISLQRYNLSIADTDILLTSSGSPSRGVNASVVQGTPGGAIGGTFRPEEPDRPRPARAVQGLAVPRLARAAPAPVHSVSSRRPWVLGRQSITSIRR